jgi:N-acetylneuraminic acid mutarotase
MRCIGSPVIVALLALSLTGCSSLRPVGEPLIRWSTLPDLPEAIGVGGPFAGVSNGALIVAGGAHFPVSLFEGGEKTWIDRIHVYDGGKWHSGFNLDRPLAYGASVTTEDGVVLLGGCDAEKCYADVVRLRWANAKLEKAALPKLPKPCAMTSAALVGTTIYVAAGCDSQTATTAMKNFWALDLAKEPLKWETLEPWPGPSRMLPVAASRDGFFYLFSGAELMPGPDGKAKRRYLTDAWRFCPDSGWKRLADMPRAAVAAPTPAVACGTSKILICSGDNGENADKVFELKDKHPGFPRDILAYDVKKDRWTKAGLAPAGHVTAATAPYGDGFVIPSGEIRPGVRSPKVLYGKFVRTEEGKQ